MQIKMNNQILAEDSHKPMYKVKHYLHSMLAALYLHFEIEILFHANLHVVRAIDAIASDEWLVEVKRTLGRRSINHWLWGPASLLTPSLERAKFLKEVTCELIYLRSEIWVEIYDTSVIWEASKISIIHVWFYQNKANNQIKSSLVKILAGLTDLLMPHSGQKFGNGLQSTQHLASAFSRVF